ncbi:VanW family protein [Eubacterium sp.]|jgi:vancomycin resistance protein YoaR|uniref:VanW family protein n=1 Tax=Eubacterium sp. TaxID=142586 RepID=UPI001D7EFBF3|nr:VanW family protein [Eubacterium sp.]MBS5620888.1 VanW family protein [Eubacterium sp.]
MKGLKKICIILCVVMMQLGIGYVVNAAEDSDEVVKEGVKIDSVNVGDMTEKEVKKAVKSHVKKKTNIKVQLRINKDKITTTLKDLGYKWENRELVEQVMEVGKQGNVIKRYKDSVDLKKNGKTFELKMGIDQKKMKAKLEELCKAFNVDAKNASLEATGHGFKIIAEKEGCEVDYETTVNQLVSYIEKQWDKKSAIQLEATTKITKPKYTTKDCKKVSNTPMGSYTTQFTAGVVNRNANIRNGAEKLNGNVVYPGERFSCNEHLVPWTEDNGWKPAGTYSEGSVVDSLGGGICQVSSTLYNALLNAEIKVVERYPHSMAVSYVPLSADAALAGDYKDLVFENNTDAPIYVQGVYTEGAITFNIYGHDTRKKGHSVEYVSKTTKTIPIKTATKKDPTLPAGTKKVTPGHVGYVAELYKITYENGKQVSKELVHTSTYAMAPTTTLVGTKNASSSTKKSPSKDKDKKSE